jgi:hypothetical protein
MHKVEIRPCTAPKSAEWEKVHEQHPPLASSPLVAGQGVGKKRYSLFLRELSFLGGPRGRQWFYKERRKGSSSTNEGQLLTPRNFEFGY